MGERWKDIEGYGGIYSVSDAGRIRMNGRKSEYRHGVTKERHIRILKPRIMAPIDHGNGYLYVTLRDDDGHRKNHYIHRLVAEAFLPGHNSQDVVDHKDSDKENNSWTNLEWVTQAENARRASPHMHKERPNSRPTNTGEKYIRRRSDRYIVAYSNGRTRLQKSFQTLEEAKQYREVVTGGRQHFTG